MVKTRFEDLDIPDNKLVPILTAWFAVLLLVPIAGAMLHAAPMVTQLVLGLLFGGLIGLVWRWSRPKRARS
jgi:hypothetical protein